MEQKPSGFKELLSSMMKRRWFITAIVLGGFMVIIMGIFGAILGQTAISGEWKELLLLLLGAFIGSYGKIIDYWFSDTDKDKMLVQKMDEEDGISLSNTADMPNNPIVPMSTAPLVLPDTKEEVTVLPKISELPTEKKGVEIDEDGDGVMDGLDFDGDGTEECLKCGKIRDDYAEMTMEG